MRKHLKKALRLARKTNDAIIFFDSENPEDSFAILDLDRYEQIVDQKTLDDNKAVYKGDLTDDNLADKMNREISDWQNEEKAEYLAEESKSRPNWQIPSAVKKKAENDAESK